MKCPGQQLESLCSQAQSEVILAAPFIKTKACDRLLSHIPSGIQLQCITRWRPEEIVAGVSDLSVWELIKARPGAKLWLRSNLHAKYYRADQHCLVGSANITATALGWCTPANLELLIPTTAAQLNDFETELFAGAIQVDQNLFELMQNTVQLLNEQKSTVQMIESIESMPPSTGELTAAPSEPQAVAIADEAWLPTLRYPEHLYSAYSGKLDNLITASQEAAQQDLRALSLPANLSQPVFHAYVGSLLLQKPIICQVDALLETPQRFGAVANFLSRLPCNRTPHFEPKSAWQTLMRWLRYFLPERYTLSTPRHSEIFSKNVQR